MARVAFVMDKPLRKIGLSGRSIVPMLIGFGCSVPAIMATRTVSSDRDRKMTILLTPYMSCSAKYQFMHFYRSVLSNAPRAHNDPTVSAGHSDWNCCGPHHEPNRVPRKARAFRYGVAQLSASEPQERCAAALGKGRGLLQRAFTVIFLLPL